MCYQKQPLTQDHTEKLTRTQKVAWAASERWNKLSDFQGGGEWKGQKREMQG